MELEETMNHNINDVDYTLYSRTRRHNAESVTYGFLAKVGAIGNRANIYFSCPDEDLRDCLLDACINHSPGNCTIKDLVIELHKCAESRGEIFVR